MVTLTEAKEVSDVIIKTLEPISIMVFGSEDKSLLRVLCGWILTIPDKT